MKIFKNFIGLAALALCLGEGTEKVPFWVMVV